MVGFLIGPRLDPNSDWALVECLYLIEKAGGDDETRTRDLCRDRVPLLGFTTTYKYAGTAKILVSRTRPQMLWVELWVEKPEEIRDQTPARSRQRRL